MYRAAIRYLDHHLGRLLDAVDRLGLCETTAVLFTVDHGALRGPRTKETLYPLGTETAMLLRVPPIAGAGATGGVVDDLIGNVDVAPTIAEAMGVAVPEGLDGRSFWPRVTGGSYAGDEAILSFRNFHGERGERRERHDFFRRAYRTAERLLVWDPLSRDDKGGGDSGGGGVELFDLTADPRGARDVAADPAYAGEVGGLLARLHAELVACGDPLVRGEVLEPVSSESGEVSDPLP